jgi:hypothetical protein
MALSHVKGNSTGCALEGHDEESRKKRKKKRKNNNEKQPKTFF